MVPAREDTDEPTAADHPAIALVAAAAVRTSARQRGAALRAHPQPQQLPQRRRPRQQQLHIDLRENPLDDHGTLRLMYLIASALPLSHALHGTATLTLHSAQLAASAEAPAPRRADVPPLVYLTSTRHDWFVATGAALAQARALAVVPSWSEPEGGQPGEGRGAVLQMLREVLGANPHIHKYLLHM